MYRKRNNGRPGKRKDISFNVRIRSIQVEDVITGAAEDVIEDLQNATRPLAAPEINDIVQAGRGAKEVAFDDAMARRRQSVPANQWHADSGGKDRIANDE